MEELTVLHAGGDRFRIYLRGHEIQVDQPLDVGGQDLGPTPTELFVASLASCVAFYGRRFMKRHNIPEQIEVRVAYEMSEKPARVSFIELRVEARSVPATMRERFQKVIEHCTVHNSLAVAPEVRIETRVAPPVSLVS
jgi:uncharacterized OsmC-like protein